MALGLGLVSACAGLQPAPPVPPPEPSLFQDPLFSTPTQVPDTASIFALSPAMQRYLEHDIAPAIRKQGAMRGLVDALHNKTQLSLEYDSEITRTAAEAFDARTGNCLSLVVMTAALAKKLELPISYQALLGEESWSRAGGLSVINGHVNIAVGQRLVDRVDLLDRHTLMQIEFGRLPLGRGQALQVIGERTIVSMFMNNRAAELMLRGDRDSAYAHAKQAVLADPLHAAAYNTLGVLYQRSGAWAAAERAYREALAVHADHRAALTNLGQVLVQLGRHAEAAALRERLARLEVNPPFLHFDRGVAAARAGDYPTARDELLREMRRDPDYHEFHFWLAIALHGLGEVEQARHHLAAAMNNSPTRSQQGLYQAKLRGLAHAH
jgi:tetratricopeptide (TPR) repeat protein